MKKDFLAVYDYGTGGIWVNFAARSEREITTRYPELVVLDRPSWMTDGEFTEIKEKMSFDIDEPPSGWLLALISERQI